MEPSDRRGEPAPAGAPSPLPPIASDQLGALSSATPAPSSVAAGSTQARYLCALLLSLLLHWSVLLWIVSGRDDSPGMGGDELQAIGIEIVSGAVLESAESQKSIDISGGATSVTGPTGTEAALPQAEVTAASPSANEASNAPPPESLMQADREPVENAEVAAMQRVSEQPRESLVEPIQVAREPERMPETKEPDAGADNDRRTAQQAIVAGGVSSRAASDAVASVATATASPGQISRFAIAVRAALGRGRPKHVGASGRVDVSFGLTESGTVRFTRIARSDGNARLDEAALQAVRDASFPTPPAGMTDDQRTYLVTFDFK